MVIQKRGMQFSLGVGSAGGEGGGNKESFLNGTMFKLKLKICGSLKREKALQVEESAWAQRNNYVTDSILN